MQVFEKLLKHYWAPIHNFLVADPELLKTATGFLVAPEKIIFYIGETHLGIEYFGQERIEKRPDELKIELYSVDMTKSGGSFLEKITGITYDDGTFRMEDFLIPTYSEGMIMPTNRGADKLKELNWHFSVQDGFTAFNATHPVLQKNEFTRIINGIFFDANKGGLHTRRIKWIDFLPISSIEQSEDTGITFKVDLSFYNQQLAEKDINYVYPIPDKYGYRDSRLQKINRFIELVGSHSSTEVQLTQFLAHTDNQFILSMRFSAIAIQDEVMCEWQSENKKSIKPDFLITNTDGYADIVEFKLPSAELKLVGKENREAFSAQINSYIAQTRVYSKYFDDPNNRKWVEEKYGIKVYHPKRYLVIGRRWQFDTDTWKEITFDYQNLTILTYDDLVDGVVAQLYG